MSETKNPVLSLTLPAAETLDPQSSPPMMAFMSGRPTAGSGVFIGNFVSHDDACFDVEGTKAHKWTFIADPAVCDVNALRSRLQRLIKSITAHHIRVGRDPKAWTPAAKAAVLKEMGAIVSEFSLTAARQQAEYWARGATAPIRDRSQPRSARVQSGTLDLGEFMLPEDEA